MAVLGGSWRARRGAVAALAVALCARAGAASAAPGDVGYRDPAYGQLGFSPTGYKPESKLWFADGWWSDMIDPGSGRHRMFRLDRGSERWFDTGVGLDPRRESHSDILWDAVTGKLYVASHRVPPESMTTLRHPAAVEPPAPPAPPADPPPPAPPASPPPPPAPPPSPAPPPAPLDPPPPAPSPPAPVPGPAPPPAPPPPAGPPPDLTPPPPAPGPVHAPVSSSPGRLWRYSYDPLTRTYGLDAGFPVDINRVDTETLVIAKDSTGMLWATWTAGNQVWVNHSLPGDDAQWATPYVLPGSGSTVTPDDISSIIAFGGNRIGVLWSNQVDRHFFFAVHVDGADTGAAGWTASAIPNTLSSDDHINLKTDSAGRVYAAVKHSTTGSNDPYISLLVRSATGVWSRHTVARVKDGVTRPNVLVDEQSGVIHVVYTGPPHTSGGRDIFEKTSPMSAISFTAEAGTVLMRDSAAASFNDVTTTKQSIDAQTGMVVLASDDTANVYWHSDSLAPASVPIDRSPFEPPVVVQPPAPPPPPPGDDGGSIHLGDGGTHTGIERPQDDESPHETRTTPPAITASSWLSVARAQFGPSVRGRLTIRKNVTRVRFSLRARRGHSARMVVVGTVTRGGARAGRLPFSVGLSRRAQAALRRYGRMEVTLTVTTVPPAGKPVTLTRAVLLRRR